METASKMYATIADAEARPGGDCPVVKVDLRRVSTLAEYHAASTEENRASKSIDIGYESYLLNLDLYEMGMHPYLPIIDLDAQKRGDLIGVVLYGGQVWLPGDTLVVWR